jgi:uncharacterized protein with ParB-like and HNH nuclease domain
MSKLKPMKEVSIEEILQQYKLIVPEIQREYVWGNNDYGIFETFLNDIKEAYKSDTGVTPEILSLLKTINSTEISDEIREQLKGALNNIKGSAKSINIGFLYSYKPSYYIGNDREEDLYLIDGQQRFTTLFLLLFYFSLKEKRKQDFISLFSFDSDREKIAFDYRVRSITHQFIVELINNVNTIDDLIELRDKQWFLANYANDVTVKSIAGINNNTGAFNLLNKAFSNDENLYFDFIKRDIKFWHFKTEETSQGEELYITMNSRGQQLADNETIRAKLFESDDVKSNPLMWSEKWEQWQDFFWKHRNKKNIEFTADEGFNEFLRWVQIIKMYEIEKQNQSKTSLNEDEKIIKVIQWGSGAKLDINYITLADIDLCFNSLKYLYTEFKQEVEKKIKPKYKYCKVFDIIKSSWLSPEKGAIGLNELFEILPILLFCNKHFKNKATIDAHNLFRFVRVCFSLSKDETIGKAIRNQITNILDVAELLQVNEPVTRLLQNNNISKTILNQELNNKLEIYATSDSLLTIEDLFWHAEDLDPKKNGEMSHLIGLAKDKKDGTFNLTNFVKILTGYEILLENQVSIWGNLIHTDVYYDHYDRVGWHNDWYKRSGFLNLVEKKAFSKVSLEEFTINYQKEFIRKYLSLEDIEKENSPKNQLYIYYILGTNNIMKGIPIWHWNGYNFGKWNSYFGFQSLFNSDENKSIYQLYTAAFAGNESKILSVQKSKFKKSLELIINWAKKTISP